MDRGNTSVATCFSCSTEEDLGVKLMHKMGPSQCHFAKGKSQPKHYEQAFWLDLYWPSGGTLYPALGPILPRRCRAIGESQVESSGNKQWFGNSACEGRLKKLWWFSRADWRKLLENKSFQICTMQLHKGTINRSCLQWAEEVLIGLRCCKEDWNGIARKLYLGKIT